MAEPGVNGSTPPADVKVTKSDLASPRFTPRELEAAGRHYGRSFGEILQDEKSDDKWRLLAWLKLRRTGYDVELEQLDDVVISVELEPEADVIHPTSGELSTRSPDSVTSGE